MRKILRVTWVTICFIVIAGYLLSCFSYCIPPHSFSYIAIFALLFPYLFIAAVICSISLLFFKPRVMLLVFILIITAGIKNISNSFAFNKGGWVMGKQDSSLRIMTWNTEEFVSANKKGPLVKVRNQMMEAINLYKPDVLCVQEYKDLQNSHWGVSIKNQLDSLGFIFSFASNDSVNTHRENDHDVVAYSGVAIFSRRPFTDTARINIRNRVHNENAVYADLIYNNRPIRVMTAHLSSFYLYADTARESTTGNIYSITYKRKTGVQYKLRRNEMVHEDEAAILRNAINNSPNPVIYCGDINSTPASYTYNKLRGNLQDAFLQKGAGMGVTFYKLNTLRIDVCLTDKAFAIQQCTVPKLYLSDHFPVVTDLKWR